MKIGKFVKYHIKKIFQYCDTVEHDELCRLMDKKYSKSTFGINYPFCAEVNTIDKNESKRYWTDLYVVRGKKVRVSSQWVVSNTQQFKQYLIRLEISNQALLDEMTDSESEVLNEPRISARTNSRYRGNPIGKAQNRRLSR